jgi:hypothetical protein
MMALAVPVRLCWLARGAGAGRAGNGVVSSICGYRYHALAGADWRESRACGDK